MKNTISCALFLVLSSCDFVATNKYENNNLITASDIISQIDTFMQRPLYQVKIKSSAVGFDVRINDFPILQFNEAAGGGTEIELPINHAILQSGKQILNIHVFPLQGQHVINESAEFVLEINKKEDAWLFDGNRTEVIAPVKYIYQGLPIWDFEADFEAVVPYSFTSWSDSRDLTKVENLDKLLGEAYASLTKAIENKNNSEFRKLINRTREVDIMLYEKEHELLGFQNELEKMLPLIECKKVFYGYNKLVRYENDHFESCLTSVVEMKDGSKSNFNYPVFFHMPKGSEKLEVIR